MCYAEYVSIQRRNLVTSVFVFCLLVGFGLLSYAPVYVKIFFLIAYAVFAFRIVPILNKKRFFEIDGHTIIWTFGVFSFMYIFYILSTPAFLRLSTDPPLVVGGVEPIQPSRSEILASLTTQEQYISAFRSFMYLPLLIVSSYLIASSIVYLVARRGGQKKKISSKK